MHRHLRLIFAVLLSACAVRASVAQDYRFHVPQVDMVATVQPDASIRVAYDITFLNDRGAHPIDIVDIGTWNPNFNLANVSASIDGRPLREFRVSTVVSPGFEVHLGAGTIAPGAIGRLHVEYTMPGMIYQDTTNSAVASLRITPTWFGDQYVLGTTHLKIGIQLPKGTKPEDALYQLNTPFTLKADSPDGAIVGWNFPAVRFTEKHMVGVSFPKGELHVIKVNAFDLLIRWFTDSPRARLWLGAIFLGLLAFTYFRFTGGTGFSIYAVLGGGACVLFYFSPGWHLVSIPIVVMLLSLNEWFLGRRKQHYMPPVAQVEGGGIKRGLTAPEAAVLLELPVAKVLSLVIFGLLKKGVLRQTQADPLAVEVDEAFRLDSDTKLMDDVRRAARYNEAARTRGVVIHAYEHPFLFLLQENAGKPVQEINFGVPIKRLIEGVAARMANFDLSDTKAFYQKIVRIAAEQAAAIGDIPQREKMIDRNFEWILMDNDFPTVFDWGTYRPTWTRGTRLPMPSAPAGIPTGSPIPTGGTSFGDVASSFAGWAQNTMGRLASAITPGSLNLPKPSGGFLDLSGADHVTADFVRALGDAASSGSGGGGSGFGGGCACVCAGCACACACAGGGR
jgi:hypothetical protein